ncbi:MAG: holo-ACP synthase [Proteobacteria bacterium]|nr:holo-ACP synthase [Pseudomonadota bacterium]
MKNNYNLNIGIDIVTVSKVGELISKHKEFLTTVFTAREIAYCEEKKKSGEHFAARFAAKESVLKALGIGLGKGIEWTDVEILSSNSGKPRVCLHGEINEFACKKNVEKIVISLSHCETHAIAQALVVPKNRGYEN